MPVSAPLDQPHPVDIHVGRRVCEKRLSLGYNQSDLGRALGLTFQQIQKYEKGANRISASKLWDTAQFFGVDIGEFFKGLERGDATATSSAAANDPMPTRSSLEIARIVPRLSSAQQKLILGLVQEMASVTADHAALDA